MVTGLTRGDDAYDLVAAAAPCHVPGRFTPDVAQLELAVTALDLACRPGAEPLEYEGLRERYLPEVRFGGAVEDRNSQSPLYAAACMRGGLQPNLLSDAGWWQAPLWQYVLYAVVITAGQRRIASAFRSKRSPGGSPRGITLIFRARASTNWRSPSPMGAPPTKWGNIDWFNHRRLLGEIGLIPPAEHEDDFYRHNTRLPSPRRSQLSAAVLASVAAGAYRHAQRTMLDLPMITQEVNDAISGQFCASQFATAVLACLNQDTGRLC